MDEYEIVASVRMIVTANDGAEALEKAIDRLYEVALDIDCIEVA